MKKTAALMLAMTASLLVVILGAWADEAKAAKEPGCPLPTGKAVMDYVTVNNPYQNWNLWPGKEKFYPGQHPHGALLTTYVSPLAFYAIEGKAAEIPDTAFIVKENYTPEKQLAAVTIMYKVAGYNPDGGDWFWLKFTPGGQIEAEGKVVECMGCHNSAKGNDWLFTGPLM